jgi:hypothetical protein
MSDELKLPADVDLQLWLTMQEHLVRKYDGIEELLKMHEQELLMLWLGLLGSMVLLLGVAYYAKHSKEGRDASGN